MSDDLRIPAMGYAPATRAPLSPSYRPRQAGRTDPAMRWAMLGAAGLGGLLLVGMGGWALMGRRPASVPVIEADTRPLRVKPDNPGGMQLAGPDELGDGVRGSEHMAPAAEAPAPQALRAQMGQTAPAAEPELAVPLARSSSVSPLPDTPAPPAVAGNGAPPAAAGNGAPPAAAGSAAPPAPAASAKVAGPAVAAPRTVPAPSAASGSTLVQLAALGSESAALAEWQRLGKLLPEVIGDHRPTVQKAERDGKAFWRLRTAGFADVADATAFCSKLRAKGASCTIASF